MRPEPGNTLPAAGVVTTVMRSSQPNRNRSFLPFALLLFLLAGDGAQVQGQGGNEQRITLQTQLEGGDWETDPKTFVDSSAVRERLRSWVEKQQQRAYWEASVDSLVSHADTVSAYLHQGPRYEWTELTAPEDPEQQRWLRRAGFRPRRYAGGAPLRPDEWMALRDSTLSRAGNAGYPFAAVGLTDVEWVGPGQLRARVSIEPGPPIQIGEVRYDEAVRVRPLFLQRYLGLSPGEPYRLKRIRRLNARLQQLPYLSTNGPPRITFQDSLAFLDLPIQKRSASRFDFVLGVLPGSGPNGGILFTGELNGELYNGFGQGERILARFEQLRPQTQELALQVDYPYVLGLPFGVEGELDLYRRDTSFLNLNWRLAATYLREGNDRFSIFWENRQTIVPGQNSAELEQLAELPDTLGISRSFFGVAASRVRTDRRFSPTRGYAASLSIGAGFRNLREVPAEDTLTSGRGQLKIEGSADLYLPVFSGTVLYGGLRGAALFNDGSVLANEQYRIGGARLLRGFDEQSIFARDYLVATLEFRLLLGGNAYLYGFGDFARVNLRSQARREVAIDYPVGLGVGVNFETRAGVFALNLGVGRRNGVTFNIGAPRVHVGYYSLF